jgi:alcohol dehydrogenase class IV
MQKLEAYASKAEVELKTEASLAAEPTTEDVDRALNLIRESNADGVIGFGGGSAIDTAKSAAVLAGNPGSLPDYEGYERIPRPGLPVVAIPTTAGTGAEVTRGVAVTDPARDVKMLLMSARLVPAAAIVDPAPTVSMPPSVTASTGLDALTHALEAYVSRRRYPLTDALAIDAISRISGSLARAHRQPGDLVAREEMTRGSLHAGMAFHNASVALVHGMSRPIGAMFHVPHGLSNAMLLPEVMGFSVPGAVDRYADIGRAMGAASSSDSDESAAANAVRAVQELCAEVDVPTLAAWGIDQEAFRAAAPKMARDALASGSPANNPALATEAEITELYERVIAA